LKEDGAPVAAVPWEDSALREAVRLVDLVVNSTSVGLKKEDPSALPGEWLRAGQLVYDTVYTPTKLQEVAQAAGCKTSAGLGMLLHQGAAAFELWTGKPAPLEVMRAALNT
jgi:shikimate dehydrogenase